MRAEKKSRRLLEGEGYFVCESRGSHGVWDLVALLIDPRGTEQPQVRVVQVKCNRRPSRARQLELPGMPGWIRCEVHIWKDGALAPTIMVW